MIAFTNEAVVGLIPDFFSELDPRPAREQAADNYAHGGGWRPMKGWVLTWSRGDIGKAKAHYPGDPPMREISRGMLRDEMIIVFECSWVAIIQPSGSFEISRMD